MSAALKHAHQSPGSPYSVAVVAARPVEGRGVTEGIEAG